MSTVRFHKQAHFEQVRAVEGSLFRKYRDIVDKIEFDDDMSKPLAEFASVAMTDNEIDEAIAKALEAKPTARSVVNMLGDLSIVPTVVLDRLQRESSFPGQVDMVLRESRVEQFARAMPLLMRIVARVRDGKSFENQTEVVVMSRLFMNALDHAGKKVFVLSDDLAWALRETELRKFPADDLRLPFQTVYVEIPEGYKVYNRDTQWHNVVGCYISESEIEGARRWRLLVVGESKQGSIEMDDALFFYAVDLLAGKSVEACLQKCRETHRQINGLARAGVPESMFEMVEEENEKLFRLLMNVVLYVTNPEADTMFSDASLEYKALRDRMLKAQGSKREKIKARMRQVGSRPRIVLGGRLVIDRHENVDQDGSQGVVDGGKRWSWKVRTLVRGHWRSQPCGPGGRDRKPKWIAPHWAGPQMAQVTTKIAEVR